MRGGCMRADGLPCDTSEETTCDGCGHSREHSQWRLCSVRSRSPPASVLTVSVIKPTFVRPPALDGAAAIRGKADPRLQLGDIAAQRLLHCCANWWYRAIGAVAQGSMWRPGADETSSIAVDDQEALRTIEQQTSNACTSREGPSNLLGLFPVGPAGDGEL